MSAAPRRGPDIRRILADPRSKAFKDLRDRAAYMYITGTHPSHLRTYFTQALSLISKMHSGPVSLDGLSGVLKLDDEIVRKLDLDEHPMVKNVRAKVVEGYRIRGSRSPNARKPYTKVFLFKGDEWVTVQIDGSILECWPD